MARMPRLLLMSASALRMKRILRTHVLVIDKIGYTPIDRKEANLFFKLVSELYERVSIIIDSSNGFGEWAEMMGAEIMTTAMLGRLLHHAHIYPMNGDSYRVANSAGEEETKTDAP